MKLIVLFVILCGILVFVQAERNDCYWHGFDHAADWASCVWAASARSESRSGLRKRVTLRAARLGSELCRTMRVVRSAASVQLSPRLPRPRIDARGLT